jgi:hypothetical protein
MWTILLSVMLHDISVPPLAARYPRAFVLNDLVADTLPSNAPKCLLSGV